MNRSAWEECLSQIKVADYYAQPIPHSFVPITVTELLKSSDKIWMMRALDCDEKYMNRTASDFEWFAEWERVLPLCAGTGTAVWYEEERRLLSMDGSDSIGDRWKRGNEGLASGSFDRLQTNAEVIDLSLFLSDFAIKREQNPPSYGALSKAISDRLGSSQAQEVSIKAEMTAKDFFAPNPHLATLACERYFCDEKSKDEGADILIGQLLIDGLLAAKKENKRVILHLRGEISAAWSEYLSSHRLLPAELRMGIELDTRTEEIIARCGREKGCRILPELILRPSDFGCDMEARLGRLISACPLAGLRFGGILTDSPLPCAGHILLKRRLAAVLSEICEDEAHVIALMNLFFDC